MGKIAVDTSFLIDWQRELRSEGGDVSRFLSNHAEDVFYLPLTVLGEFSAGFSDLGDVHFRKIREALGLLDEDEETALAYRSIYRVLKVQGRLIGANDLWIAAAAIRHGMPLVTRNKDEFERVPDLQVLAY